METPLPSISVIIPAYNAEDFLRQCLTALGESSCAPTEIIVVNDGSTDRTAALAAAAGATVMATAIAQSGPGAARNLAAAAAVGDVLVFIDADVVVQPDTLMQLSRHFAESVEVAAVFGSYDTEPGDPGFLSQYKNLQHHFVHQTSSPQATTFWAGCGAVRRSVFSEIGGFDVVKYARPSIEDIELGYRLAERGLRINLDRAIQVKHLKRWTFWNLLQTEIFCRAIPWSDLMISRRRLPVDLNVGVGDRLSAVLIWLVLGFLALTVLQPGLIVVAIFALLAILYLNRGFYGFLWRHRGLWFLLRTFPVHMLYYLYSSVSFAFCWIRNQLMERRRSSG